MPNGKGDRRATLQQLATAVQSVGFDLSGRTVELLRSKTMQLMSRISPQPMAAAEATRIRFERTEATQQTTKRCTHTRTHGSMHTHTLTHACTRTNTHTYGRTRKAYTRLRTYIKNASILWLKLDNSFSALACLSALLTDQITSSVFMHLYISMHVCMYANMYRVYVSQGFFLPYNSPTPFFDKIYRRIMYRPI